jgi:HTH-type transcriptional regulator / antitoxin HigA
MRTLAKGMKDSYFELVHQFPLVPLRNEKEYDAAVAFLGALAIRGEKTLDQGERSYLSALAQFVEDYEERHHRIAVEDLGVLDVLKFLMRENRMKSSDLGKLLGSRSVASQILNGRRELSKTHILILADRFKVEPGLFMERMPSR